MADTAMLEVAYKVAADAVLDEIRRRIGPGVTDPPTDRQYVEAFRLAKAAVDATVGNGVLRAIPVTDQQENT